MIINESTGLLYPFEDIELLAYNIYRLFSNDELAKFISNNSIKLSENRHNREHITSNMISIYNQV